MEYTIQAQPSYSLLEATLGDGETIVAESGAMTWMSGDISMSTSTRGGVLSGLGRAALGGESFFQNTFQAEGEGGMVGLAPGQPGDIVAHEMSGGAELYLEKSAYLASEESVNINTDFQGLSGLFNEGLFILRASGSGMLFFNAYGDVEEVDVDGAYRVDNGHAVAWEPTLEYQIIRGGRNIRSFLFSDQLILRFTGHGKLWVQSRNPRSLASWVFPFRPQAGGGN